MLERPDHVDGHPVLQTLVANDDLFLEELVRDKILRPTNYAGNRATNISARHYGTLRRPQIETDVQDTIILRRGRSPTFYAH